MQFSQSDSFGMKRNVSMGGDGKLSVEKKQDIGAIMDYNKSMRDGKQEKDMRKLASIPFIVVEAWKSEGFDVLKRTMHGEKMGKESFQLEMKRRLNDPKNAFLRASKGNA